MRILVCITHVPDTTSRIRFAGLELDKNEMQFIIGPYDDYALSKAIDLKSEIQAHITVLNVGLQETESSLRKALALGADQAIRVNVHPADSYFTACQIAEVIKENPFDLALMGRESIDYHGGVVPGMVGELTGIRVFSPVTRLRFENGKVILSVEIEGGLETYETTLPLIAGCQEPVADWKIPNLRGILTARSKPLQIKEPVKASPRIRTVAYEVTQNAKRLQWIEKENMEELIRVLREDVKIL